MFVPFHFGYWDAATAPARRGPRRPGRQRADDDRAGIPSPSQPLFKAGAVRRRRRCSETALSDAARASSAHRFTRAEQQLAAALRAVADGRADEVDVFHHRRQARRSSATSTPDGSSRSSRRYGDELPRASATRTTARRAAPRCCSTACVPGPLGLLRDLNDLYLHGLRVRARVDARRRRPPRAHATATSSSSSSRCAGESAHPAAVAADPHEAGRSAGAGRGMTPRPTPGARRPDRRCGRSATRCRSASSRSPAATLLVSGLQLGWLEPSDGQRGRADPHRVRRSRCSCSRRSSAILARDVVAGTGDGRARGQLAVGRARARSTSPPGSTSDALGLFLLIAAVGDARLGGRGHHRQARAGGGARHDRAALRGHRRLPADGRRRLEAGGGHRRPRALRARGLRRARDGARGRQATDGPAARPTRRRAANRSTAASTHSSNASSTRPAFASSSDRHAATGAPLGQKLLLVRGDVAELRDRGADDPRHLHLADSEQLADLGLGEIALEAQAEHEPGTWRDEPQQALEGDAMSPRRRSRPRCWGACPAAPSLGHLPSSSGCSATPWRESDVPAALRGSVPRCV